MTATDARTALLPLVTIVLAGGANFASRPAQAAVPGAVSISWGTCGPVVSDMAATNQPMSMIVSTLGTDDTHNAYHVRFMLNSADGVIPDAWRFDLYGCQGGSFIQMNHLPPASLAKSCPPFQGYVNTSYQLRDYRLKDHYQFHGLPIRGVLASTYPEGMTANPAQRYFLAEFRFDHSWSVEGPGTPGLTCGGLETPLCIALLTWYQDWEVGTTSYIRKADGLEYWFYPGPATYLTVNGLLGCPSVPAATTTWGQIKGTYRR